MWPFTRTRRPLFDVSAIRALDLQRGDFLLLSTRGPVTQATVLALAECRRQLAELTDARVLVFADGLRLSSLQLSDDEAPQQVGAAGNRGDARADAHADHDPGDR